MNTTTTQNSGFDSVAKVEFEKGVQLASLLGTPVETQSDIWMGLSPSALAGVYSTSVDKTEVGYNPISADEFLRNAGVVFEDKKRAQFALTLLKCADPYVMGAAFPYEGAGGHRPSENIRIHIFIAEGQEEGIKKQGLAWSMGCAGYTLDWEAKRMGIGA